MRPTLSPISILPIAALLLNAGLATAQTYPSKPIRMITAQAGGGADLAARLIAQGLTERMGQQVIVDNRGVVAVVGELMSKRPPTGTRCCCTHRPYGWRPFCATTSATIR